MKYSFCKLSLICFCLSGCHDIKPGVYPDQSEMKKGPGLFTGEQGEFDILSPQKETAASKKETKQTKS